MDNLEILAKALEYMEQHLEEDIRAEDIAGICYCSKSTLEKLFRFVNHISVRDYLIRRRMTKAARALVECPDSSILEVALQFGYSSHEAFTRAFRQIWNCSPSEYRMKDRTLELFPRLYTPLESGDVYMKNRRNFDISELYDLFQNRKHCYFVCCDIKSLIPINEISHQAGDLAILKAMQRMEDAAGGDDVVFRIGGDEFALLTASEDEEYAEKTARSILAHNGECIEYEGQKIPLNLYCTVFRAGEKTMCYNELFTGLHTALQESKE